jgi:hypothetical protein
MPWQGFFVATRSAIDWLPCLVLRVVAGQAAREAPGGLSPPGLRLFSAPPPVLFFSRARPRSLGTYLQTREASPMVVPLAGFFFPTRLWLRYIAEHALGHQK